MRSSAGSRHAQTGALADQMFANGFTEEGSSRVPIRTTVSPTLPEESAKRWDPQFGQNLRRTVLPLSPFLLYTVSEPVTSMLSEGKMAFAVPLPAMC